MLKAPKIMNLIRKHGVKVSSTEPATGEEVWLKKGNQLFDKNNYAEAIGTPGSPDNHTFTGGGTNHCLVLQCRPNTTYTVQKRNNGDTNRFALASAVNYPNSTNGITTAITNFIRNDNANKISITSGASDKYLIIHYYRENETVLTKQQLLDSIMINQGSNALTYETYVEKEVYCKNDNGVYEKFYSEADLNKTKYSTEEQIIGNWIDGKPLYRKVLTASMPQVITDGTIVTSTIDLRVSNLDMVVVDGAHIVGKYNNAIYNFPIPFVHHGDAKLQATYDIYARNIELRSSWSRLNSHKAIFSVIYTKTTD